MLTQWLTLPTTGPLAVHTMDPQIFFNILVSICGFLGGIVLKIILDGMKELRENQRRFPDEYARRDDLKELSKEIKDGLNRIFDKLDTKADAKECAFRHKNDNA